MNHTAKTEKEKSDAESSQQAPSDSNIDIHILRNRYSDGFDSDHTVSRIVVRWQMRSLQETTVSCELSCELKVTEKLCTGYRQCTQFCMQ